MTEFADLLKAVRAENLDIMGGFDLRPDDGLTDRYQTLVLLGPLEPGFWATFTSSDEWRDQKPDPVDRWSTRVVTRLAERFGARALFPFGGPPWHPFFSWALRSGRAWSSPVSLLVHDQAGLLVSYRGALAMPERLNLPEAPSSPCETCVDRPCVTACPASALTDQGYDVPACKAYLSTTEGTQTCMSAGCQVRRACPVSQNYARDPDQSAYHMGQFHS